MMAVNRRRGGIESGRSAAKLAPKLRAALLGVIVFAGGDVAIAAGEDISRDGPLVAQARNSRRSTPPVEVDLSVVEGARKSPDVVIPAAPDDDSSFAAAPIRLGPGSGSSRQPTRFDEWTAEALFAEGYRLEQAGNLVEADQAYQILLQRHPASPLAGVATDRLSSLRKAAAARPRGLVAGDYTCTAPGIYPKEARWCGVVRQQSADYLLIEIYEVKPGTIFAMGFSASVCTGDRFIGYFSHGERVWVPRRCMAERP